MSQKNLKQAKERLMHAREDMLRDLGDLDEPTIDLEAYSLTHDEAEQLYDDFRSELNAIQDVLAQILTRRTTIVGPSSAGPKDLGPIPPWTTPDSGPPWTTPDRSSLKSVIPVPEPEPPIPAPPIPPWEV